MQGAIGRDLQGEDLEVEYRRYDKAGREIFIHTIGRIIRNEAGESIGVFGIDLNITCPAERSRIGLAFQSTCVSNLHNLCYTGWKLS